MKSTVMNIRNYGEDDKFTSTPVYVGFVVDKVTLRPAIFNCNFFPCGANPYTGLDLLVLRFIVHTPQINTHHT